MAIGNLIYIVENQWPPPGFKLANFHSCVNSLTTETAMPGCCIWPVDGQMSPLYHDVFFVSGKHFENRGTNAADESFFT